MADRSAEEDNRTIGLKVSEMAGQKSPFTKHKAYRKKEYIRRMVRDAIEGSDAVKRQKDLYLPIPEGFLVDEDAIINLNKYRSYQNGNFGSEVLNPEEFSPYYHQNPAYCAYLQRARFPEITGHAHKGLVGTASRRPLEFKLPKAIAHLEDTATEDGLNLDEFFARVLSLVLQGGNASIAVEISAKTNEVYLNAYPAESLINWRVDRELDFTELAVFEFIEDVQDPNDIFISDEQRVAIAYTYGELEGVTGVLQTKYIDGSDDSEVVAPSLQGRTFNEIPVVFVGASKNSPEPQNSPLLGIAEIAMSIYMKDADLSHAEYMTCNPNLVISGTEDEDGIPNIVGSTSALILSDPAAKAYYTNTDTGGLSHVLDRIRSLFEEAAMYGVSLVGPTKKAAEAAETARLRQNAQGSILVQVVKNVEKGLEKALEIAARLKGGSEAEVEIIASKDFNIGGLPPEILQAIKEIWLAGGLSLETLLRNLKEAGILDEYDDVETELARIAFEGLGPSRREENDDDNDDDEGEEGEE